MLRPLLSVGTSLLALCAAQAAAQVDFLYTLNEFGQAAVNGTKLDALPSKFDPDKASDPKLDQRWWDMVIKGEDRYALRLDGRIEKNGALEMTLSTDTGTAWVALVLTDADELYALRTDGRISRDGTALVNLPGKTFNCPSVNSTTAFAYVDLISNGTDVFALRSDGAIFKNTTITPIFELNAKDGLFDGCEDEGESPDTEWRNLALHPVDGRIFALRTDGSVLSADPSADPGDGVTNEGTIEAELPFGNVIALDRYYRDLEFTEDAAWFALRADGDLYSSGSLVEPLVDFPGTPAQGFEQTYIDLATGGTSVYALRFDGRVHADLDTTPVLKLKQGRWRRIEGSNTPPNVDNIDNTKPTITKYAPRFTQGDAVSIPLVAQDIDQASDALTIVVDESMLPVWLEYDADSRTFQSTLEYPTIPTEIDGDDTKGGVKVKYTVDDGKDKPVKGTLKFKVLTPDTNENKNKKPMGAKIKKATAFVGVPYSLRMLASDRDGDEVTITVDEEALPEGATFDGVDTINWDAPTIDDIGKVSFVFLLDDGSGKKPVKRKVGVKVVSSLLGF